MKTERRHELEKNQLADWLAHKLTWAEQNASLLVGVVVAAVVVIGVVMYWQNSRSEKSLEAWNEYFGAVEKRDPTVVADGLEKVAKDSGAIVPGQMADILLGDIALNDGINQLNTDREAGEKRLNEAKNYYVDARNAASDPRLRERATFGLARFYESLGLLDEAMKEYKTLADNQDGLYQADAVRKLEFLSMPTTLAFAKAYRDRTPVPKPAGTSMFNLDDLNKLPKSEASFPGETKSTTPASTTTPAMPAAPATATAPAASATSPAASASPTPSATPAPSPAAK
ncbi:MAG: tetratricopeptide repeat protein [Pirellulales bacterium]